MKLSKESLEVLKNRLQSLIIKNPSFKFIKDRSSITEQISYEEVDISEVDLEKIIFEDKFIYLFQKGWEKQYNLNKNNIKDSNDLLQHIIIPEEYVALQRIGYTPKQYAKPNTKTSIPWFNIDNLNTDTYEINDTQNIQERVEMNVYVNELGVKSIKSIPITKNDILVSFKLTIGRTKIFNDNNYAFCNEAIDVLTPKLNVCNYWLSLQFPNQYNKNTSNAVKGKTLNNELKEKIVIQIPQSLTVNSIVYSSFYIQQLLSFLIKMETDSPVILIEKGIEKLNQYKNDLLYTLFEKNISLNSESVEIFNQWKKNNSSINFSLSDIVFESIKLSQLTNYISEKNLTDDSKQIYGVTNKLGGQVLKDTDMTKTTKRTKGNKGYKIIKKDNVIYNPSRINIGSIGIMEDNLGVISTLYEIFELQKSLSLNYFKHYISSEVFKTNVLNNMDNQVRPSLKYTDGLENFSILIPKELDINSKKYSSYEIQEILARFITEETDLLFDKLIKSKNILNLYKNTLIDELFIEE